MSVITDGAVVRENINNTWRISTVIPLETRNLKRSNKNIIERSRIFKPSDLLNKHEDMHGKNKAVGQVSPKYTNNNGLNEKLRRARGTKT